MSQAELDSVNNTDSKVKLAVYFFSNAQSFVYLCFSFALILLLITKVGFAETKEIIMFILGSNAGIIQPDKKN
jgi:hypothetical protein